MSQQGKQHQERTGVYLSPMAQRRTEFEQACGGLFVRLRTVDGIEAAAACLQAGQPDLLVLDLDRFAPAIDLAALGTLIALRGGAPVLLLCPFANAEWLPTLMAFGPVCYLMTPCPPTRLADAVRANLTDPAACRPAADASSLRGLLALRARVQATLREAEDAPRLAEALCEALCAWPGVVHAAVLRLEAGADLQLTAQQGKPGLLLGALLSRGERLLQAPLRHAFPGLMAAASGEPALLDDLDQAGEPAMAEALRAHGVTMALGLPIAADGPGAPRGALSLLLDRTHPFSYDDFTTLFDVARLAAGGLRMAEITQENEHLLARLTHVSTTDALTGVANRRHGEAVLEKEIKRARRYRLPLALLAFDIDRFKAINDTFGYPVGDVALRTVAEVTRAMLRASDVLIRSGGEEFHIVAPHTSAIDGLKMAEKIRLAIERTAVPGCDRVTVSLGVAQLGEQESGDSLTQRVDAAMARAKRAGRNCVELAMG